MSRLDRGVRGDGRESHRPSGTSHPDQRADIEQRLNDWPLLARYARDNATYPPPKPGEKRVVFMGDSIDYYAAMVDAHDALRKELSDDGLHPNAAGYKVMAPLSQKAIDGVLDGGH